MSDTQDSPEHQQPPFPPSWHISTTSPIVPAWDVDTDRLNGLDPTTAKYIFGAAFDAIWQNLAREFNGHMDSAVQELKIEVDVLSTGLADAEKLVEELAVEIATLKSSHGGVSNSPRPAPTEKFAGGSHEKAEEFATAIVNACLFESFRSEQQQIIWCQGYLTGDAVKWSSVITHHASRESARFNFATWISAFRSQFCSRNPTADARVALRTVAQGSKTVSQFVTEFKAIYLALDPMERDTGLVLDRFLDALSVPAFERLTTKQPPAAGLRESMEYLVATESQFSQLEHKKALLARAHAQQQQQRISQVVSQVSTPKHSPPVPRPSVNTTVQNPPPSRDPNAMDVDRTHWLQKGGYTKVKARQMYIEYLTAQARMATASSATPSSSSTPSSVTSSYPSTPQSDFVRATPQ